MSTTIVDKVLKRACILLENEMSVGVDMINWNTLQPGDLVDVDGEYNFYPRTRIIQKLEDVAAESGLESGPGFIGIDQDGDEIVFSIQDVDPSSYAKYAMAENKRLQSALKRLIKEYNSTP